MPSEDWEARWLGLAAPGVVDVLVRAGLEIEAKIKTYKHMDETLEIYSRSSVWTWFKAT